MGVFPFGTIEQRCCFYNIFHSNILDENLLLSLININDEHYLYFYKKRKRFYFASYKDGEVKLKKIFKKDLLNYSIEKTIFDELYFLDDEESA